MKKTLFLIFLGCALTVFHSSSEAQVVISEVMVSPSNNADDFDGYIELYNTTGSALDLDGWQFTDGDALDTIVMWDLMTHGSLSDTDVVTNTTILPAGGYAVILDPEYNDTGAGATEPYDFPIGTVILTVGDTTLGNGLTGTDPITLYDSAGTGLANVVDTYGTPVEAEDPLERDDDEIDGIPLNVSDGSSALRIDLFEIDEETNWHEGPPTPGYGDTGDIANIIYVKQGASGDGTSWASAYGLLQDALDDANTNPDVNQIWVAAGKYYPTYDYGLGEGDRGKHLRMINGVSIYGGFPNVGDPNIKNRDPKTYETILSGDIGEVNYRNDNCYHIFFHPSGVNLDATAIIDGFTITAAFSPSMSVSNGAGMYNYQSSPTIKNCSFTHNYAGTYLTLWGSCGGGMYNYQSSPDINNCYFYNNTSNAGGGIYNSQSNPKINMCYFYYNNGTHNLAGTDGDGGGVYNYQSSPVVTNCSFIGNDSVNYGGGMLISNSGPTITNSTFSGNTADAGGGVYINNESSPTLTNCILWNDTPDEIYIVSSTPTVTYSDVQYGWPGTGNIDADPCFVDAYNRNFRLFPDSLCIDTGDPDYTDADYPTDLDGRDRYVDSDCNDTEIVDMGAYEFTYAYYGDFDGSCDVDFIDYAIIANHWLTDEFLVDIAPTPAGDGIVDEKDLAILCNNWLSNLEP